MENKSQQRWMRFSERPAVTLENDHDHDIYALFQDLVTVAGETEAKKFGMTLIGWGYNYGEQCAMMKAEIDRVSAALPVLEVAALVAFADDVEAPYDAKLHQHTAWCAAKMGVGCECTCHKIDPRTPAQVWQDDDWKDYQRTIEDAGPY